MYQQERLDNERLQAQLQSYLLSNQRGQSTLNQGRTVSRLTSLQVSTFIFHTFRPTRSYARMKSHRGHVFKKGWKPSRPFHSLLGYRRTTSGVPQRITKIRKKRSRRFTKILESNCLMHTLSMPLSSREPRKFRLSLLASRLQLTAPLWGEGYSRTKMRDD